jgi:hypothetical protein
MTCVYINHLKMEKGCRDDCQFHKEAQKQGRDSCTGLGRHRAGQSVVGLGALHSVSSPTILCPALCLSSLMYA